MSRTLRVEQRASFPDAIRLQLLEGDLDKKDAQWDELNRKLDRILKTLVGVLVAVTTACIMLVLNLAVAG